MFQMKDPNMEALRLGARLAKAIAVEKYKAGDLAGAKAFAAKAKDQNPVLSGLLRLNAILDVLIGFEEKIEGEVDWYAILAVDPTADVATIQKRIKQLLLSIVMDDEDNSLGSIDEAQKILADSWSVFRDEKSKKHYDKRRQNQIKLQNLRRADYEKEQRLKRTSQVPSVTYTPVIFSGPNSAQDPFQQGMIQQTPLRVSGNVNPPRRASPGILSGLQKHFQPPQRSGKGKEPMVQPPLRISDQVPSLYTPVVLSAVKPAQKPKMFNRKNEEIVEVKVEHIVQLPLRVSVNDLRRAAQILSLSAPKPVASKMFNEKNEEIVEVKVEQFVQPPLSISSPPLRGSGGESKRKPPPMTNVVQVNQLRRISEDVVLSTNMLENAQVYKIKEKKMD